LLQKAQQIKRQIADKRGLAGVLISLAKLRMKQDRWADVPPLADEAAELASETQAGGYAASAHVLLGLKAIVEDGDLDRGALHYTRAARAAWEHHPVVGRRINRSIQRNLRKLIDLRQTQAARTVAEQILQGIRDELGDQHPQAVSAFEEIVSDTRSD
jgi:hypothetical protein